MQTRTQSNITSTREKKTNETAGYHQQGDTTIVGEDAFWKNENNRSQFSFWSIFVIFPNS